MRDITKNITVRKQKLELKNSEKIESKKLSSKHQLFCDTYLANGMNATQAYLAVYTKVTEPTARANGSKLLTTTNIANFINNKKKEQAKNLGITLSSQLEDLKLVKTMAMTPDDKGKRELTAYVKALEVQNKMLGLDAPTKIEMSGKDGEVIKVEHTIKHNLSKLSVEEKLTFKNLLEKSQDD